MTALYPLSIWLLPTNFLLPIVSTTPWSLIDKPNRTSVEDQEMLQLAFASAWHWNQRPDCTPTTRSVSYWQIARIYALLGQVENARQYGQLCLQTSQEKEADAFCQGFAYEALARAEMVTGNRDAMNQYLQQAHHIAERLEDPEDKKLLLGDLETIK